MRDSINEAAERLRREGWTLTEDVIAAAEERRWQVHGSLLGVTISANGRDRLTAWRMACHLARETREANR